MNTSYSTFWVYVKRGSGLRDGGSTITGRSPQSVADELGISIFSSATGTGEGHRPDEYIEITFPSYMFPSFSEAQGTYNANDPSPNGGGSWAGAPHEATLYVWIGTVRMVEYTPPGIPPSSPPVPPGDPPAPPTPPAPATKLRRWIDGFELSNWGEGANAGNLIFSRDASRVPDGFGFPMRQPGGAYNIGHSLASLTSVNIPSRRSWERFYFRIRALPAADTPIWRAHGQTSGSSGVELYLTTTGTLKAYNITALSALDVVLGTSAVLTLNKWYRADVLLAFGGVPPDYAFQLFLNGLTSFQTAAVGTDGILSTQYHAASTLGTERGGSTIEIDFDDWINAEYPVYFGYDGGDWKNGSHVRHANVTGFGPTHSTNWVGDYRTGIANPVTFTPTIGTVYIAATVADSVLDAVMSAPGMQGHPVAAALVGVYFNTGGGTQQIGYNINGAGNSLASIASSSVSWVQKLYTTAIDPAPEFSSFNLILQKDSATSQRTITGIHAVVELIGSWGPEDLQDPSGSLFPGTIVHNSSYPQLAFDTPVPLVAVAPGASTAGGPLVFVALESGTYIGNAQGQDIPLSYPSHWVWIRPLTGDVGGSRWFSSMISAHRLFHIGCSAAQMPQAIFDDVSHSRLRISATDAQANASGVVYQWVSVSDVGMRYLYNGAARAKDNVASYGVAFPDSGFTPDSVFAWPETYLNTSSDALRFKGPIHASAAASLVATGSTTVEADCLSMAAAALTVRTSLNISGILQVAYSAWRMTDGAATGDKLFHVGSYTGNGAGGTRDIALTLGANWPLLALVVPHNGTVAYMRDPSHTGANSSSTGGANSIIAIVAGGIDKITVGTLLNTNAVTYSVFALRGHPDGWYNGGPIVLTPAITPGSQFVVPLPSTTTSTSTLSADALRARTNVCDRVLHRLGDTDQTIWTKDEIYTYLRMAAAEMADRTRLIWDQMYLDDIMELTGQRTTPPPAVVNLPTITIDIERASHPSTGSLTAFAPSDLRRSDSGYETTLGEMFGYTWKQDGIRGFRMVRVPSINPVNLRIDYWRHFEVSCSLSELQPRYFMYLSDYMQWKCLIKHGPGQDYKLAQLYKERWERGLSRILWRVNRRLKNRVGRMGGGPGTRRPGPPRPSLPWQYGSRIRR